MGRQLAARAPGRGRPGHPGPESGHPGRDRLRPGVRHPVRPGPREERLRGRTFIQPSPDASASSASGSSSTRCERSSSGKRLVVVDDSIVRGNTQRALVRMLREAGAAEVHVRISSPPVTWPCFYGIDFASRAELIATGLAVDEVRASIGADTLGYISRRAMIAATDQPRERLCTACFTGNTRSALPAADTSASTRSSARGHTHRRARRREHGHQRRHGRHRRRQRRRSRRRRRRPDPPRPPPPLLPFTR